MLTVSYDNFKPLQRHTNPFVLYVINNLIEYEQGRQNYATLDCETSVTTSLQIQISHCQKDFYFIFTSISPHSCLIHSLSLLLFSLFWHSLTYRMRARYWPLKKKPWYMWTPMPTFGNFIKSILFQTNCGGRRTTLSHDYPIPLPDLVQ